MVQIGSDVTTPVAPVEAGDHHGAVHARRAHVPRGLRWGSRPPATTARPWRRRANRCRSTAPPTTTPPDPAPVAPDHTLEVPPGGAARHGGALPGRRRTGGRAPEEVVLPPDATGPPVEVPPEEVTPPPAPVVPAVVDVTPESSSSPTGSDHVLTAAVTDAAGNGVPGAAIDFELVAGPADGDVGTPGNTPLSPDLGCVTAGGGQGAAATCTVSYTEPANDDGTDRVLAWIDLDGDDATVEADVDEGRNASCVAELDQPGQTPEPDGTDCVTQTWTRRVPFAVDVTTDLAANVPGASQRLEAVVLDQNGEVLRRGRHSDQGPLLLSRGQHARPVDAQPHERARRPRLPGRRHRRLRGRVPGHRTGPRHRLRGRSDRRERLRRARGGPRLRQPGRRRRGGVGRWAPRCRQGELTVARRHRARSPRGWSTAPALPCRASRSTSRCSPAPVTTTWATTTTVPSRPIWDA